MKTLLLLRHAKSSHDDPDLEDHDRPLAKRGRTDAPRMGRLIAREGLVPERILCSTALRARDTAERVARESGFEGEIHHDPRLYLADPAGFVEALREIPEPTRIAMVVGHNPGLEDLLSALTGGQEHLATAAIARIRLPLVRWADLVVGTRGALEQVWRPREVD